MKIKDFLTEQWMNQYERKAKVNLTDTSVQALRFEELLAFEPDALKDVTLDYGWITGEPQLRQEILSFYQDREDMDLTLTHGALQANELAMSMILKSGDHVITFSPGYQQFEEFPRWSGCDVDVIDLEEDWSFDLKKTAALIRPQTRMIVFASPSNPTGTVMDPQQMEELIALCRRQKIWILCDEVYRSPEDDLPCMADLYEYGISTGSLSKLYGLSGLRLGWLRAKKELIDAVNVFRDYTFISCGPLSERLAWIALRHRHALLERGRKLVDSNRKIIKDWLDRSKHFSCQLPAYGTVAFLKLPEGVDDVDFARSILEDEGIFFVPGSCFSRPGYLRLGLGQSHENLPEALERLERHAESFIKSHH